MQRRKRLDTFPYSYVASVRRFSSTVVYPPCRTGRGWPVATFGGWHDGYTT